MPLDAKLISLLACPACRGKLENPGMSETGEPEGLLCPKCSLVYPVKEEIPVMLAEEAVSFVEWRKGKCTTAEKR
jgi:uncharacterized protein YbaR (Trm112 family)